MSTYVIGFKPPGDKWKAMKAVWDACKAAKLDVPKEVDEFFEYEDPDDAGVKVDQRTLEKAGAVKVIHDGHPEAGYEIIVSRLPKDVTVVRVENSW